MGCKARNGINFQGVSFSLLAQDKVSSCKVPTAEGVETVERRCLDFCGQYCVVNRIEKVLGLLVDIFCVIVVKAGFAFNLNNR